MQKQKSKAHFAKLTDDEKGQFKTRMKALSEAAKKGAAQAELDGHFFHLALTEEPTLFWDTLTAFLDGAGLPAKAYRSRAELEAPPPAQ